MRKEFNITKKLTIPRISNTRFVTNFICILSFIYNQIKRFAWRDIASLFVWRNLYFILLFVVQHTILTKIELQRIFWVLHPEVQCIIAVRAVFAHAFLKPAMRKAEKLKMYVKEAEGTKGTLENSISFSIVCDFYCVLFPSMRFQHFCF